MEAHRHIDIATLHLTSRLYVHLQIAIGPTPTQKNRSHVGGCGSYTHTATSHHGVRVHKGCLPSHTTSFSWQTAVISLTRRLLPRSILPSTMAWLQKGHDFGHVQPPAPCQTTSGPTTSTPPPPLSLLLQSCAQPIAAALPRGPSCCVPRRAPQAPPQPRTPSPHPTPPLPRPQQRSH